MVKTAHQKQSRFLIITVVLCLFTLLVSCRATGVTQISEHPGQEQILPPKITIVNWNAQKGINPQFKSDLWLLIEEQRPDFVFLQEARADLLEANQIGGYFAKSWKYPWADGTTIGVLTLSKVPPVRVQPVPTKYREFFITAPKVSLITEYPLPNGEQLLAVNVHLLTFERWGTMKMRAQLDELKEIMARHSGPIVFAGDFNTWNYKRLGLVQELAEDLQLVEVTDFPPGRHTADRQSSCLNWLFGIDEDLPLDRVYYRGFSYHAARVLSYDSSDHRAILVTLILEPGRERLGTKD
ncbi:MAG: endonuclease/exonuclease/phosphatase family protein [Syntrophobacterales bacterium]|jgi:endonuclease/exonuclease/phosphatase (EEP) superfamily protein YafD